MDSSISIFPLAMGCLIQKTKTKTLVLQYELRGIMNQFSHSSELYGVRKFAALAHACLYSSDVVARSFGPVLRARRLSSKVSVLFLAMSTYNDVIYCPSLPHYHCLDNIHHAALGVVVERPPLFTPLLFAPSTM
jgi:hypothetical protein